MAQVKWQGRAERELYKIQLISGIREGNLQNLQNE